MRRANSNCEERFPPNASFSIDVRLPESQAGRSPHPCDSGLRAPSNPSRKAVTSSGTPFRSPDPASLLQESAFDEGLSPMVDVPPSFRTRRRRRTSKRRWDASALPGIFRYAWQSFLGQLPQPSPKRSRRYRRTSTNGQKAAFDIDPTISKRADAAKRPPRASKNPRPGTEEHPSGNATRTKERSQTNRTPNRSANKTGTVREHGGSFILAAQER